MVWIISLLVLLILALLLIPGAFIHSVTFTAVTVIERKTNEVFALTLIPEFTEKWIPNFKSISWQDGSVTEIGSNGTIRINNESFPIEVTQFIPNYRWTFKTPYSGKTASVQISFYRTGTTETRVVLLIKASSSSILKRTFMAFGKKPTQQKLENILLNLNKAIENTALTPILFEDTTAEQNPNLTL
jgi:hypothetical protein